MKEIIVNGVKKSFSDEAMELINDILLNSTEEACDMYGLKNDDRIIEITTFIDMLK